MGRYWDDNMVNFIINEVKQCPHVWNSDCPQYKNKLKRQQFWDRTTQKLNKQFLLFFNPCTHGEVTKKWNNLKSYYRTEIQRVVNAKETTECPDNIDEGEGSTWRYAQAMEFLSDTTDSVDHFKNININVRNDLFDDGANGNNTDNNPEDNMDSIGSSESNLSTPQHTYHKSRKRKPMEPLKELCESYNNVARELIKIQNSPNAAFGSFIANEINQLSKMRQIEAKSKITALIFELQAEQLKNK